MTMQAPPVLFAAVCNPQSADWPDCRPEADWAPWEQELRASGRSPALKAAIITLVLALAAAARRPAAELAPIVSGGMRGADAALSDAATLLDAYARAAETVIDTHGAAVAGSLVRYVVDATGTKREISTAPVLQAITDKLGAGVAQDIDKARMAANVAVQNWHVAGGTQEELRAALLDPLTALDWQATRVAVTEIQQAYIDQFRRANDSAKVRRIAMPTACDDCVDAAGVYDADDDAAYDEHPNGQCEWEPADDDAEADFSRRVRGPALVLRAMGLVSGPTYALRGGVR